MKIQLVTPPTGYPVSLAEARLQLGIDTQDYDARLAGLIAAATEHVETLTGRALLTRTYRGFLDWWPSGSSGGIRNFVQLEKPPLISVAALTTYDDFDAPTVYPPAQYFASALSAPGRLVLRRGQVWPIPQRVADGIQIDWTAGYGPNPADVPETIRLAILMMVGALNEQRGDEIAPPVTPPAAEMLLAPFLVWPPA